MSTPDDCTKNIEIIMEMLKFDGAIPIRQRNSDANDTVMNIASPIARIDTYSTLYYVSIDPPHGDTESYVVVDDKGNCHGVDLKTNHYFVDNVVVGWITEEMSATLLEWEDEFKVESGSSTPESIAAFLALLKTWQD